MTRFIAGMLLLAGIMFGSIMTYAVAGLMLGGDIISEKAQAESTEQFLDSVRENVGKKKTGQVTGLKTDAIRFSCTQLGCLISQGEMIRSGMGEESSCLWLRPSDGPNGSPELEITTRTHFVDLTGNSSVIPDDVVCRDLGGAFYYGQKIQD